MSDASDPMELFRRLTCEEDLLSAERALADMSLAELVPADRPYVVLNMVASADGQATFNGRAGPLGGEADRQLFHSLRCQVDAVMVGARTVTLERYGRLVRDPARRDVRRSRGLAPGPIAVLISGRLELASDIPLLQDEHSRVLIATSSDDELHGCRAQIEYLRGSGGALDLTSILRAPRVGGLLSS